MRSPERGSPVCDLNAFPSAVMILAAWLDWVPLVAMMPGEGVRWARSGREGVADSCHVRQRRFERRKSDALPPPPMQQHCKDLDMTLLCILKSPRTLHMH